MAFPKFEFALVPSKEEFGVGIEKVELLAERPDGKVLVRTEEDTIGIGERIGRVSKWEETVSLSIKRLLSEKDILSVFKNLEGFYLYEGFPDFGKLKISK